MSDTPAIPGPGGASPETDPSTERPQPGGRYEVLGVLGQGGFGTVYRTRYIGEGGFTKEVAVKVLNQAAAGDEDIARRLRDEARLLGLLRHRAIVQVDRLARLDDQWAVVMELIDGLDLVRLAQQVGVPPRVVLEVAAEVADALHVAWHCEGPDGRPLELVHRDVKPGNILVTRYGEVKLLDLGIARAQLNTREAVTQAMTFGSPGYMSPERLDGTDGPEGDVYSLGVVILELMMGRNLGKTSAIREKHDNHVFPQLEALWNALGQQHEDLVEMVGLMLAWDPQVRPLPRDVARACRVLAEELGGPGLRDWAEDHVGPLLDQVRADQLAEGAELSVAGKVFVDALQTGISEAEDTLGRHGDNETMVGFVSEEVRDLPSVEEVLAGTSGGASPHVAPSDELPDLTDTALAPVSAPSARPQGDALAKALQASKGPPPSQDERRFPLIPVAIGIAVAVGAIGGLAAGVATRDPAPVESPDPISDLAEVAGEQATPIEATTGTGSRLPAAPSAPGVAPGAAPGAVGGADFAAAQSSSGLPAGAPGIDVQGDAEAVFLTSPMAQFRVPGPVPAGSYAIEALFLGVGRVEVGRLDVSADERITLRCSADERTCEVTR